VKICSGEESCSGELLWGCSGDALGMLWGCSGSENFSGEESCSGEEIALENCSGDALGVEFSLLWGEVALGKRLLWRIALGMLWGCSGDALGVEFSLLWGEVARGS